MPEPIERPRRSGSSRARRALGATSAVCAAVGIACLTRDVAAHEQSGQTWLWIVLGVAGLVVVAAWSAITSDAPSDAAIATQPPRSVSRSALAVAGVVIALALQVMVPLGYYLGDDPFDERFAWRMFSAVRVYQCDLAAFEAGDDGAERQVPLMNTVQAGWVTTMRRNRESVLRRYLEWRCAQHGVRRARVTNRCTSAEGRALPAVVRSIDCASGGVVEDGR